MQPWPIAYSDWIKADGNALRLQILETSFETNCPSGAAGTVLIATGGKLIIATGEGKLSILRLKPAGKKEMDVATFLNGYRPQVGDRFL